MYINPDVMTASERNRIDRWLEVNGCTDQISVEPIIVRGNVAEYVSLGRGSRADARRIKFVDETVRSERRKVRIRVPLRRVPAC